MTTQKSPNAIVFDLGKVLVEFDYDIAARKLMSGSQLSRAAIRHVINTSPLLGRYETGMLTTEQFFQEVRAAASYSGEFAQFSEIFGNIFSPIQAMIDLHAEFRSRNYPTYVFSNTNDLAIRDIRKRFPFFKNFTDYVLSYEHGFMKPDARFYEVVERVSGRREGEILYFDDRPENIETGLGRGWQAILHENPGKTRAAVSQLGLLG